MKKKNNNLVSFFDSPIHQKRFEAAIDIWDDYPEAKHAMFNHSIFCQTYLPYRNPGDDITAWRQDQGNASLIMQSLQVKHPKTNELTYLGLPYGTRARLILAYLNTMAIKTQDPRIDVESSITAFTQAIGLQSKGRDIKDVKTQLSRIAASLITLNYVTEDQRSLNVNFTMVKRYDLWFPKDEGQRVLWPSYIELSNDYFEELCNRAIPLDIRALAALKNSPMALDAYSWLAQRLYRVKKEGQFVTWKALKDQFGANYGAMKNFKRQFREVLKMVKLVYKDARFEEVTNKGFNLYTSPPPIPKKTVIYINPPKEN